MLRRRLMEVDPILSEKAADIAVAIHMLQPSRQNTPALIGDLSKDALGIKPDADVADIDPVVAERLFFVMRGVNMALHPKPQLGTSADQAANMTANVPQPGLIHF